MTGVYQYMLFGLIVAEELVVALFFARFWRATRDRLFLFFTLGFVMMAVHRFSLGVATSQGIELDQQAWFFVTRAFSYLLILAGIVDKNVSTRRAGLPPSQ